MANHFFKEAIALAKEHKVGIDNVIKGLEVLALRRQNAISMHRLNITNK